MESNEITKVPERVLTKKDLNKLAVRTVLLQASFNYERMQAGGFMLTQIPFLKKIYKNDPDGLKAAMVDNLDFINTSPHLVGFLEGLLLSMEEGHEERQTIRALKNAIFGPMAGIGDAIFWFTVLPILAGIASSMAIGGSVVGPILFFLAYCLIFASRFFTTRLGYNLGVKAIPMIKQQSEIIGRAATVLGVTVIGGLIASYVHITVLTKFVINKSSKLELQSGFFDRILPNLLPFAFVFLLYYLIRKRKTNPVILIAATFVLVLVLSFLGIL
ncbi:PTS system mannose/fructose/sorbose family transporter subunit IID [Lactovum miscens]|uniref:PTS system galactosamine-specific IID component n=1 Tax=Lactovum miscens TaxID=190387 RepID=A0A841CAG4_9LACT|nr:PTS system mannose/fructose/sorbose family transporter subunit IID [Lactovum miscens]MBB5888551.1 PTS system galactosamine-specific IID component [Lactovum miscens]